MIKLTTLYYRYNDKTVNGRFGFNDRGGAPYYGKGLELLAELHLTYEDDTTELVCTDES